jgi:hypothetical protein
VQSATHNDDSAFVTLGFTTFENFSESDLFQALWELDLNNNNVFGESQDACISLEQVAGDTGTILRATLQTASGCTDNGDTADATRPAANAVQFQLRNSAIRAAGLGTGTAYQYKLRVTSASGGSDFVPETTAAPIAVAGVAAAASAPGAPQNVTATAGDTQATVSWSAPASNGGAPITSYQITRTPSGPTTTVSGSTTSTTITGLTNGTSYTFSVAAVNGAGTGPTATSNAVTPAAAPPSTAPPTPCAGCQSATASPQQVQVTVQGVLAIARGLPDTINFGTVTRGVTPTAQAAGQLDYTNTLYDDNPPWNVTVQSTNLTRSAGCAAPLTPSQCTIPYGNATYTPGGTITAASGSTGMPVAASAGAFGGSGTTSDPKTVATAAQGTYGTFAQAGATLGLSVPIAVRPGTYNGTLTYTITG